MLRGRGKGGGKGNKGNKGSKGNKGDKKWWAMNVLMKMREMKEDKQISMWANPLSTLWENLWAEGSPNNIYTLLSSILRKVWKDFGKWGMIFFRSKG